MQSKLRKTRKGEPLRSGYTTGACAAAAAKAATLSFFTQEVIKNVTIKLPAGERVCFEVSNCSFDISQAQCSVVKDAGDDPDVTDGAEICATVSWTENKGVVIERGEGVGFVTKPGLEVPVGMAAINSVPRKMIVQSINEAVNGQLDSKGLKVIISVPRGEELAKRTLNRRLGIIGGISILGTNGVVIPYSIEAYKVSISQALDIAVATGCETVVLTTGRRSEKYAQEELILAEESFIQTGDFIGYALTECAHRKLAKIIIWGMVGKLSKLAAGHFYTNVSDSIVDVSFLAEVSSNCGISKKVVVAAREAVNAHHFLKLLGTHNVRKVCTELCLLAAQQCQGYAGRAFEVECIMSDYNGTILGRANAKE